MRLSSRVGLLIVVTLVMARSVAFLWWPQSSFDADQAVTGLMAKHLAEGRALPVFQYAQDYVLVLESWLAAPLVALTGHSTVAVIKSVPVALNIVAVVLLYRALVGSVTLSPSMAVLASLPVALPGPITASDLTDALGMNIEPLVFALLLWWLRERPVALGATAAIGTLNREFTIYAIVALLVVDAVSDRRRDFWRGRLVAVVAFMLTWVAFGLLAQSSSPYGPGTSVAMFGDTATSVDAAASFICVDPRAMPRDAWNVATHQLPVQFGVGRERLARAGINASGAQGVSLLWPLPAALILFGAGRGIRRAWRDGPRPATWFGVYLVLIGVQAVVAYATLRCGNIGTAALRYTLLSLLAPAGALTLALERESSARVRGLVAGAVLIWAAVCAADHARLLREYLTAPPRPEHRLLAEYLEAHGLRYIDTDYWTGYHVAFLTGERVKPLTEFDRVREYALEVYAHADEAVEIRRVRDDRCAGGVEIADWFVCPPASTRQK